MADEPTNAEPVDAEPVDPVDGEPEPEPQDEAKLNKTQLQQISSVMGALIKKSIEKEVIPLINQPREAESLTNATSDNPAYQKFNERLQEKIYQGDVVGAFQDFMNINRKAEQNLTKKQQTELNKSLSAYEEKPNYKDVFPEMSKMANEYVANGYPPGPAAELAYEKSLNSFLMGKRQDNSASLAMETGGRRPTPSNSGKLPPQFEKAYQQGKAKGLFKDRKEYADNLDPRVRAQYGIQ